MLLCGGVEVRLGLDILRCLEVGIAFDSLRRLEVRVGLQSLRLLESMWLGVRGGLCC